MPFHILCSLHFSFPFNCATVGYVHILAELGPAPRAKKLEIWFGENSSVLVPVLVKTIVLCMNSNLAK
jgi:hypothetical protein